MKKTTILTLVMLLAASGMASAADFSKSTGRDGSAISCVGPIGVLSSLLGVSCGPDRSGGKGDATLKRGDSTLRRDKGDRLVRRRSTDD